MPSGWYGFICAICFEQITFEECAVDRDGTRWDVHKGACARQAGVEEEETADA